MYGLQLYGLGDKFKETDHLTIYFENDRHDTTRGSLVLYKKNQKKQPFFLLLTVFSKWPKTVFSCESEIPH